MDDSLEIFLNLDIVIIIIISKTIISIKANKGCFKPKNIKVQKKFNINCTAKTITDFLSIGL